MKFVKYIFAFLVCFGLQHGYAQSINPATQIQWPRITGSGAPAATCPSSTVTIGTPYTDTSNNVQYFCGVAGWFHPANRAGDTLSGRYFWNYTSTQAAVSADLTTDASSSAHNAITANMTVTKPSIFGYGGVYSSCIIAVANGICYAASTQAYDGMPAGSYTHTVAFQPSVIQSISKSPDSFNADVYGVAIGMTLGPGVWPGSGARIEGPTGQSTTNGQVAVGYDMVDGITPVALQSRPGCRNATCNSAEVRFQAKSSGVNTGISGIYQDFLGNMRFYSPGSLIVSPIGNTQATSSNNYNSSNLSITASGWNGSSASDYSWNIFQNVNSPGAIGVSQLRVAPPAVASTLFVVDSKMQVTGTADLATGTTINSSPVPVTVASPTAGRAACIKTAGTTPVIGYCSTTVDASGACTCN